MSRTIAQRTTIQVVSVSRMARRAVRPPRRSARAIGLCGTRTVRGRPATALRVTKPSTRRVANREAEGQAVTDVAAPSGRPLSDVADTWDTRTDFALRAPWSSP